MEGFQVLSMGIQIQVPSPGRGDGELQGRRGDRRPGLQHQPGAAAEDRVELQQTRLMAGISGQAKSIDAPVLQPRERSAALDRRIGRTGIAGYALLEAHGGRGGSGLTIEEPAPLRPDKHTARRLPASFDDRWEVRQVVREEVMVVQVEPRSSDLNNASFVPLFTRP